VINIDRGYVSRPEDFEFVPGVLDLLRAAQTRGLLLVVITNQSGIARGYFTQEDYARLERYMRDRLSAENVQLSAVYACPHHPEGKLPEFAISCSCRKPQPGMIHRAQTDLDLDLANSLLVGDKDSDLQAAKRAGVGRAFLVQHSTNDSERGIFDEPLAAIMSA